MLTGTLQPVFRQTLAYFLGGTEAGSYSILHGRSRDRCIGLQHQAGGHPHARIGYSKKLCCLERTHRCSIGVAHELLESDLYWIDYAPTATHRGDGFTKAMAPSKFLEARTFMGMVVTARR